jgi:protocatechuate 3,4-dioxygenase beta subunit
MMRKIVLLTVCLLVLAGISAVAVAAAPPQPGPGERPFAAVIQVARPRAAILTSADGAVENFAVAENLTRTIVAGQSVRFVIGPGFEGVWYDQANGTLSVSLEVARQEADGTWTVLGSDGREATESGPFKAHGNLHVDAPFESAGVYTLRATVVTTARPAEQTTDVLIEDRDEVLATINVVDPADLGSISGQVVTDEDGRPIPGIRVVAGSQGLHVRRQTRTDRQGRYILRGLPPGEYLVGVMAEGTPFVGELYNDARSPEEATPVTVATGQDTLDINFSLARRPRPEPQGEQGARGELLRRALPAIQRLFQGALKRFERLPEGVQAQVRQRVATAVREHLGRGKKPEVPVIRVAEPRAAITEGMAAAENFAREGGQAVYVPAGRPLRFVASTASQAVWFGEAEGQVTLELELFIKEGDEWVSQGSDRRVLTATGPAMRGARLAEDLVLDGLGTYEIMARVTTTATPAGGSPAQDVDEITAMVHVVGPEDVGSISGEVLNEDGEPVPGARVLVIDPAAPRPVAGGHSDESGSFNIKRVPAGTFVLRAAAPGTPYADEFYETATNPDEATPVTVEAGGEVTGIAFSLPVGGSISGQVTDEDGNPIADARVEAVNRELGVRRHAKAAEDGSYVIEGLMAGEYLVRAGARGYVPEFYDDAPDPDVATPVGVALGQEQTDVNFALAPK